MSTTRATTTTTISTWTEEEAKTERRKFILRDFEVSLVGFNPASSTYEFEVFHYEDEEVSILP